MVDPNPHRSHSFGELRALNGRSWVVCRLCQRYVPARAPWDRDTRTTTFSCSVCGGRGELVADDPYTIGLQHDPRPRPIRHVNAVVRLRVHAALMEKRNRERRKVPREDVPQASAKLHLPPEPRFVLKPFPCRTFGDLDVWGLKATIHCIACHRHQPLEVGANLKPLPLFRTRFRCTGTLSFGTPCGARGLLSLTPADRNDVPTEPFVSVCCHGHDHSGIDVSYLVLSRPPWQGVLGEGENFGCPGCGKRMQHVWHAGGSRLR